MDSTKAIELATNPILRKVVGRNARNNPKRY